MRESAVFPQYHVPKKRIKIDINDISSIGEDNHGLYLKPHYAFLQLYLSPLVLQYLIKWCIQHGYIVVSGTFNIPVRNKVKNYG